MLVLVIIALLILIYLWSSCLILYHEKATKLVSDESKCFHEDCKSIVIKQGSDKAVMMIHGFPTTPAMYSYAARRFKAEGYDVYVPLIPTFGADYKDFEKSNFSSWYLFLDDYFTKLEKEYKEVYLIGTSMGGAMALRLSENHNPTAIAVIAAPVVYNSLFRDHIVTSWSGYIGRIIALFCKAIKPGIVTSKPKSNDGNEDWKGYSGTFPRQGVSLMYGLKETRKRLGEIKSPMLSIHDKGDKTVPFGNQNILRNEVKADSEFIVTEMGDECHHTHHALLSYKSVQEELTNRIISFFNSHSEQVH